MPIFRQTSPGFLFLSNFAWKCNFAESVHLDGKPKNTLDNRKTYEIIWKVLRENYFQTYINAQVLSSCRGILMGCVYWLSVHLFISDLFCPRPSAHLSPPEFIFGFSTQSHTRAVQIFSVKLYRKHCSTLECMLCTQCMCANIKFHGAMQWMHLCSTVQWPSAGGWVVGCTEIKWFTLEGRTILHHTTLLVNLTTLFSSSSSTPFFLVPLHTSRYQRNWVSFKTIV